MAIASMIIEIEDGAEERVLPELGKIPGVGVYGVKGRQIVTVIEGDTFAHVNDIVKTVSLIERITGVYPVYAGEHE